jgi:hypothetical protein
MLSCIPQTLRACVHTLPMYGTDDLMVLVQFIRFVKRGELG